MPSSPGYKRKYHEEWLAAKDRGEDKDNNQRHAARRQFEKTHGNLPPGVDVDHKKHIEKGGTNAPSNLRARSVSANRSDNGHKPGEKQKKR